VDCVYVAEGGDQWRAVVNTAMNTELPYKPEFLG
jgi:hypothetical protein